MKLIWITDPHFNFLNVRQLKDFVCALAMEEPDALLVGGDIGEAPSLEPYLKILDQALECPTYFVLGNHDYYRGSIAAVRGKVSELCRQSRHLVYLSESQPISLSPSTALIGHDGWADGRLGDYQGSKVLLNDYTLIHDFNMLHAPRRLEALNRLGDEAAAHLAAVLPAALEKHQQVILLTHVPPFRQACWHMGRISGDHWLPHMTCGAVGDAIEPIMRQRGEKRLTVFCGHTHGGGVVDIQENLQVITGAAEYGAPAIGRIWEIE